MTISPHCRTERRHDAVTHELVDGAAVFLDYRHAGLFILGENFMTIPPGICIAHLVKPRRSHDRIAASHRTPSPGPIRCADTVIWRAISGAKKRDRSSTTPPSDTEQTRNRRVRTIASDGTSVTQSSEMTLSARRNSFIRTRHPCIFHRQLSPMPRHLHSHNS